MLASLFPGIAAKVSLSRSLSLSAYLARSLACSLSPSLSCSLYSNVGFRHCRGVNSKPQSLTRFNVIANVGYRYQVSTQEGMRSLEQGSRHGDLARQVRAKRERNKRFYGLLPESQGQNLALTVLSCMCQILWIGLPPRRPRTTGRPHHHSHCSARTVGHLGGGAQMALDPASDPPERQKWLIDG